MKQKHQGHKCCEVYDRSRNYDNEAWNLIIFYNTNIDYCKVFGDFQPYNNLIQVLLTLKGDPVLCREGRAEEGAGITAFDFAGVTIEFSLSVFG